MATPSAHGAAPVSETHAALPGFWARVPVAGLRSNTERAWLLLEITYALDPSAVSSISYGASRATASVHPPAPVSEMHPPPPGFCVSAPEPGLRSKTAIESLTVETK